MTLLEEIQALIERTYSSTGIRLESFLIGRERCAVLSDRAGEYARELNDAGRTFLRLLDGNLLLAIYYSSHVVDQLEKENPKLILNERNVRPLIVFVEEITHALHAALQFLEGHRDITEESFSRNLELQGKVDTYLVLQWVVGSLRCKRRLCPRDRRWIRHQLFEMERYDYADADLAERYREVNALGAAYTGFLDRLKRGERVAEIRGFRPLRYEQKRDRIRLLSAN